MCVCANVGGHPLFTGVLFFRLFHWLNFCYIIYSAFVIFYFVFCNKFFHSLCIVHFCYIFPSFFILRFTFPSPSGGRVTWHHNHNIFFPSTCFLYFPVFLLPLILHYHSFSLFFFTFPFALKVDVIDEWMGKNHINILNWNKGKHGIWKATAW